MWVSPQLDDLARVLQDTAELETIVLAVAHDALQTIPGARHTSVTVADKKPALAPEWFSTASDATARAADRAQRDHGQGPTLTCMRDRVTVRCTDLARDQRWPELAPHAHDLGVSSVLSVQLAARGRDLGALSVYSPLVAAFTDRDEQVSLLLASHAATSLTDALEIHHLHQALTNRDTIGQAKGILMARHTLTADQAFLVLVRTSGAQNRKLAEVADEVTRTGTTTGLDAT